MGAKDNDKVKEVLRKDGAQEVPIKDKRFIPDGKIQPNTDIDDDDEEDDEDLEPEHYLGLFNFGFFNWMLIIIVIILVIVLGSQRLFNETSFDKINRIKNDIYEAQQDNIALADEALVGLNNRKENILNSLGIVLNDITIYENCKLLNQTGDLPVDCSTITLSLQQQLRWRVNSQGQAQEFKPLKNEGVEGRVVELLDMYPSVSGTVDIWEKFEKQYAIKKEVAIAIAKADSSLGDELSSINNIGNVGNNDRGDRVHYSTIEDGIEAIYKTLNNKYLGNIYNIGYLSQGGRTILGAPSCSVQGEYCYATSEENWNINVTNTLKLLYNDGTIDETFEFRIK